MLTGFSAGIPLALLAACKSAYNPINCAAGPLAGACPDGSGKHLPIQGNVVKTVARAFGLRHDEKCIFTDGFSVYDRVVNLHGTPNRHQELERLHALGKKQINGAMAQLAQAMAGHPSSQLGSRYVRRFPAKGKRYVVFSDHHFTFKGHRTNFFEQAGNQSVYVDALEEYRKNDFIVVENGDVEDLVIFDPTWSPGEVQKRRCMNLEQLKVRRLEVRYEQLARILADPQNASLLEAYRRLDEEKKLVRTAGNHDYDNQRDEFLGLLNRVYPNLQRPSDIILLDRDDGSAAFAIMHGHQFDLATNPISAPRFGETISETLALYYQGPDRNWRWVDDDVGKWARGEEAFLSNLALGEGALTENVRDRLEMRRDPLAYDLDVNPGGAHRSFGALFDDFQGELFEQIFKQTIAWHYFKSASPAEAFLNEVLTGDRFFKFQLLDESWIKQQLLSTFPDESTRPKLVLGHTHEVRLDALDPADGKVFPWYINAGSVGRFENLVWGVEIVDGDAKLISWSRESPPDGKVVRREWKSFTRDENAWVQAQNATSPVPPAAVAQAESGDSSELLAREKAVLD